MLFLFLISFILFFLWRLWQFKKLHRDFLIYEKDIEMCLYQRPQLHSDFQILLLERVLGGQSFYSDLEKFNHLIHRKITRHEQNLQLFVALMLRVVMILILCFLIRWILVISLGEQYFWQTLDNMDVVLLLSAFFFSLLYMQGIFYSILGKQSFNYFCTRNENAIFKDLFMTNHLNLNELKSGKTFQSLSKKNKLLQEIKKIKEEEKNTSQRLDFFPVFEFPLVVILFLCFLLGPIIYHIN